MSKCVISLMMIKLNVLKHNVCCQLAIKIILHGIIAVE